MKYQIKGTIKQKLALAEILHNGGNVGAAMRKCGYSPKTAKTPQKLTESMGFQLLTQDFLPDQKLLSIHRQGLEAVKFHSDENGQFMVIPDFVIRGKFVELAYKIKGLI